MSELALSTIEEAMQRAELAASVEWPGEFARQILFLALQTFAPTDDDDAWRKRGVEIRALRATITQQAQELERLTMLVKNRREEVEKLVLEATHTYEVVIPDLKQQLAASQARVKELEEQLQHSREDF